MTEYKYTNRLINETSPYLLQHAHNPVDWYPWGEEALQTARQKDMPILLSIGYSSCHWCHVMEHESFVNEKIADIMNENFVCIKVDREERPDLDELYMNAVQAMTGSGGWPMTVFLTPSLKPFFAGTYFPPTDMHGRPGFLTILTALSKFYREQREKAEEHSNQVVSAIREMNDLIISSEDISQDLLHKLYNQSVSLYDRDYGGFGDAPKFPQSMVLSFLMRYWYKTNEPYALKIAEDSLKKMAYGGIYDHIGGGFHRYSVDERWLVPHFEKMLYDNALLSNIYLEAYQITKDDFYRKIATETLDYVIREMYNPSGGFYSAQDADSEGKEGKYYVWSLDEVWDILGENTRLFAEYYGMTGQGNFEHGTNILHIVNEYQANSIIDECRQKLFNEREKRIKPEIDDKILTSWNALMISSMAFGYQVLKKEAYLDSAIKTADLILSKLSRDGILLRTYRNGISKYNAYAEDYAFFINALIDLYETTFDMKWLSEAIKINNVFIMEFWDENNGGFYYTGKSHESLIVRSKPAYDSVIPSANSVSAMNFLRLARFSGDLSLSKKAETIFKVFFDQLERSPFGFPRMICALDFYFGNTKEIVIVSDKASPKVDEALNIIHNQYIPNKVLVFCDPNEVPADIEKLLPLLEDRIKLDNKIQIYVCENNLCKSPISDIDDLKKVL
ncbi:TPA: thioredoxin domain-containing protein [bacterium]|nr:thioredoxin domain-containing protein [bacterium]